MEDRNNSCLQFKSEIYTLNWYRCFELNYFLIK